VKRPRARKGIETHAEPIGDIVARLLRSAAHSRKPRQLWELRDCWAEVVGEEMVEELVPIRVQKGEVLVRVQSPALYFEMCQFGAETMQKRLDEVLPGRFTSVRFCQ